MQVYGRMLISMMIENINTRSVVYFNGQRSDITEDNKEE